MAGSWSRRKFNLGALAAAAATACTGRTGPAARDSGAVGDDTGTAMPRPRGIVFITADDLGWRDLSSYGLQTIETPHIDRLVADGAAFTRAFDVVSSCASSRATYVTGQYPHTHGVTGLVHRFPELSLPVDHPTIIRQFQAAGMRTAIQGKWHLAWGLFPEDYGYDEYLPTDLDQVIRSSDEAVDWLEDVDERPFFLELNYMQPHRDISGEFPQEDAFPVEVDTAVPPDWWGLPDWPEIREEVAGYLSRVRWMDALIGEVLDALDRLGLADDTLVVFVSDNGPPFPGCKTTLYDRGVGTPLAFRWPRGIAAGWSDVLVQSVDLAPTLLELLGLPALDGAQGRSLAALLRGETTTHNDALFSEMERHSGDPKPTRAVRTDRYKYIRNLDDAPWGSGDGDGAWKEALADEPDQTWDEPRVPEELYDLEADPLERDNLAGDAAHADVLAELRDRLLAWAQATGDFRVEELPVG